MQRPELHITLLGRSSSDGANEALVAAFDAAIQPHPIRIAHSSTKPFRLPLWQP